MQIRASSSQHCKTAIFPIIFFVLTAANARQGAGLVQTQDHFPTVASKIYLKMIDPFSIDILKNIYMAVTYLHSLCQL